MHIPSLYLVNARNAEPLYYFKVGNHVYIDLLTPYEAIVQIHNIDKPRLHEFPFRTYWTQAHNKIGIETTLTVRANL